MQHLPTVEELVRTSMLMTEVSDQKSMISIIVEQTQDVSGSDIAGLYLYPETSGQPDLLLAYQRGRYSLPKKIAGEAEFITFLEDCKDSLVVLDRNQRFFSDIFLHAEMNSAIALPLYTPVKKLGVLVLNSKEPKFYGKNRLLFLNSFSRLSSGLLHNNELHKELQQRLKEIEALHRYQESIFESMTNLLVTTDSKGRIHYFNTAAAERLGMTEEDLNGPIEDFFQKKMGKKIVKKISQSVSNGEESLGIEGIYKKEEGDLDFSLNISPLKGKRGKHEGITLLFSDQTRERELSSQVESVREERRVIKDMFSRYLSQDVVQSMVDKPELISLGGDKKNATIFFADIRGYTSFSEGKEPEYIVEVLNEYFSEAVEIVIKYKGYIDKFIGDCIMAAWGVPMESEEKDAVNAVSCAVEIQELVQARNRRFFTGEAKHLRVGIGMHTGPLVAGNLGSDRRMDYSVIGDTVNIAARLEGVAGANDVIITQQTRELIGDHFKLKELEPVRVKGKEKPLHIFNVLKRIS